ncbi:MAG: glycosyltransferase family 4 protein [Patescibacteria group bacterium]
MKKNKLTYIANLRLPTERAHSIQIMKMCEAFVSEGIEVELVVPDKKNNLGESEVFKYYGIKNLFKIKRISSTDLLGKTRFFGKLFYWIDLVTFLIGLHLAVKIEGESIIYSRDPILFLPFLRMEKCSMWAEIHDIPKHQLLFFRLLRRVAGVVVITKHLKRILVEMGLGESKIMVAPDAVDTEGFNISVSQKKIRQKLGIPLDRKVVMYTGLFDEWKGYRTLLEASLLLSPEIKIVMMGGTPEQVNHLRGEYPKVIFWGFRPYNELAENQRAADILVVPNSDKVMISKYFTSPLKLFAYMTSGVPIIASDLPSLREIVDESTVFFFTSDDPKSLANTINYILSNPNDANKKAEQALIRVREYSWQNRARKILEFIHV